MRIFFSIFIYTLFLSGCGKPPKVTVYRAPKQESLAAPMMTTSAQMPKLAVSADVPSWHVPDGWQAQPLGELRKGSWRIEGVDNGSADVSVLVFPGEVGGWLANVNRWCGQIGMPSFAQEELECATTTLQCGDLTASYIVLQGDENVTLAACIAHKGYSWFFKSTGDIITVQTDRAEFENFVTSVRFEKSSLQEI
jgi:hypothetical protein